MKIISDLQTGKVGEYLVCADLILNGCIAFPSEQGLPFDIIMESDSRLFKIQVKTTRMPKLIAHGTPTYTFHIGQNGKNGHRKQYKRNQVDLFALVALDTKRIGYLPYFSVKSAMTFRVPEYRGIYHDEQGKQLKKKIIDLKSKGLSAKEISEVLNLKLNNVYKYTANISKQPKGTNSGTYLDELTFDSMMKQIKAAPRQLPLAL